MCSRSSGRYFFSHYCEHTYPVYDPSTGTLVCEECALVLEQGGQIILNENPSCDFENSLIRFKLHDFCCNGNVAECIENDSFSFFKNLVNLHYQNCSEKKQIEILAFSLYATLARHGAAKSIQDIYALTGVEPSVLWKIESNVSVGIVSEHAIDYLDRFCYTLDISKKEGTTLRKILLNFPIMGSTNVQCITATTIYLFCKEYKIKRSLKMISHICSVASVTIRNIANKLNPIYKRNISLLADK